MTDSLKNAAITFSGKASDVKDNVSNYFVQKRLEKYVPISETDLVPDRFRNERILRVANYDSRVDKIQLTDSVGFYEKTSDRRIPTIFSNYIHSLGYTFLPYLSDSVFIADPFIEGKFIEIDEYYNYMKQVRINELTVLAQALGACHVDIRLKTNNKKISSSSFKFNINIKSYGAANGNNSAENRSEESFEIWASTDFNKSSWSGEPTLPTLIYFKNESDIQSLIQMVMFDKSRITRRTYSMRASSSSGVSLTEAANIGASLKGIDMGKAGVNFEKRAREESESFLEYTIVF